MQITPISFHSDRQKIVGTLLYPDNVTDKTPTVMFYHGRGSSQKRYIERATALTENGFTSFVFDFRGCGDSEGDLEKLTVRDGIDDGLAAYDFLVKQQYVDSTRIGLFGASYGGYLASVVSARRKIKVLVLQAAANYLPDWELLSPNDVPYVKMNAVEIGKKYNSIAFRNTKAIQAISEYTGSLLVIRNELDEVVPKEVVEDFYNCATRAKKRKLEIIKGTGHYIQGDYYKKTTQLNLDWFLENL